MVPTQGGILCAAYIIGLGLAELLAAREVATPVGGYGLLGLGVLLAYVMPWYWRTGPRFKLWLVAGFVGLVATLWWSWRVPHPGDQDISQFVGANAAQEQVVTGWIDSQPRLTRSDRIQFWLKASDLKSISDIEQSATDLPFAYHSVQGRLYVTVPLLKGTGFYPGQFVQVTGQLYRPKPAQNPGEFDFQAYLARQGGFAGLSGKQVEALSQGNSTFWEPDQLRQRMTQLRQQIVRTHVRWLGSPAGPLVSAMVLGRRPVDLPYDIQDQFVQAGLAHTLAASGFHVSLLLSVVMGLTRSLGVRSRVAIGLSALALFVGLTGIQPSIMRAAVMGVGALIALATQRNVRRYSSLLMATTLLLLVNPLWIADLGFQLSVLATLGLLVTVPPLVKGLDWMPPTLASLVAVPLAATLWTLPLQLYAFGVISPYSILLNILSTPFVIVMTLGGTISALAGLIWPEAGSAIAWLLYYPTHWLIALVQFCNRLPGSSLALGNILFLQMMAIYGLWSLSWLQPWWQRRQWIAAVLALAIVVIPIGHAHATLTQATIFATPGHPVLLLQDRNHVTLVGETDPETAQFQIVPFLRQQGIRQIDTAIALDLNSKNAQGWKILQAQSPIRSLYGIESVPPFALPDYEKLTIHQAVDTRSAKFQILDTEPILLHMQLEDQSWLIAPQFSFETQQQVLKAEQLDAVNILWWSGEELSEEVLNRLQPQVAIASANEVNPAIEHLLKRWNIQTLWTGRNGAIQWTPQHGFQTLIDAATDETVRLD